MADHAVACETGKKGTLTRVPAREPEAQKRCAPSESAYESDSRPAHNFARISVLPEARDLAGEGCLQRATPSRCPFGGACHTCPRRLQRKLEMGEPEDEYEREADRVAGRVMRAGAPGGSAPTEAPPIVHEVLGSPGQALEAGTRARMEARLGHDFGAVRVHTDGKAAASARAVQARAYTVGREVVFGEGQAGDVGLLAHELVHVVQQSASADTGVPERLEIERTEGALERDAASARPRLSPGATRLQRQPVPPGQTVCEDPGLPALPAAQACRPRTPEQCVTYEDWLNSFRSVRTFSARDTSTAGTNVTGQSVLGSGPASHDPSAPVAQQPPSVRGRQTADRFIDHPTDTWVRTCLPENLRQTAYMLPADCADVAVILRHVWLSAHHRTEQYGGWTVGDRAGGAQQGNIGRVIGAVYSGNVQAMVSPYSDTRGHVIRSRNEILARLHPGDILVWEHHENGLNRGRTGGHTQTVVSINRDSSGLVTGYTALQGNQPIGEEQATEIRAEIGAGAPSDETLKAAPGRRVESETVSIGELSDTQYPPGARHPETVCTWGGDTILLVAGPPRTAARPPVTGRRRIRRLTDWVPALRRATRDTLQPTLEAAAMELRATIEGGGTETEADVRQVGEAAGERLWALAKAAHDLGEESHFRPLSGMRAVIHTLGASRAQPARHALVETSFGFLEDAFVMGARGATTVDFTRRVGRGTEVANVLLTGFDPNVSESDRPPVPGRWNPSGAAVLALDGTRVPAGARATAAVEGVVLPVSYREFGPGLVERVVRPLITSGGRQRADAVITVSEDPTIPADDAVRLERYAVGVHTVRRQQGEVLEPIEAEPGQGAGPLIIETGADVSAIAAETAQAAGPNRPAIRTPRVGTQILFRFADAATANVAATALGVPVPSAGTADVSVRDSAAIGQIVSSMQAGPGNTQITFRVGGRSFTAAIVEGPGGNFLSNEVSYRVLRLLAATPAAAGVTSFHVHTQTGSIIPQDTSTRAARTTRQRVLKAANRVRTVLIATLQRVIRSVASRIIAARP